MRHLTRMQGLALGIVGALLVFAGIALVAMTARGHIEYRAAASRHGGEVVDLAANAYPKPGQHGSMVRVFGAPTVVEAPYDLEFGQHANTAVLTRHVEMFQWREVRIGTGVHYELDWVDRPINAGRFEKPAGHTNPGKFPVAGKEFDAGLVRMGGFKLGPVLVHALPGSSVVTPDMASLPMNLAATFSPYEDYLTTSARPDAPQLGDLRVSWSQVPMQPVTVVARVDGDRLSAAPDASEGKGYEVEIGDVSLLNLFPDMPMRPDFVGGASLLAVLLAALGAFALLIPVPRRRDPLLALALGALAVGAVASVLWLGNDARMTALWGAVMVLGALVTGWRLRHIR